MATIRFWNSEIIRAIAHSKSDQLKDLAVIAGISPAALLQQADFSGIDLRFQDLTGINLDKANFEGAIVDSTTILNHGKSPITNRRALIEISNKIISDALPQPDIKQLSSVLYNSFGKSIKSVFYIGNRYNFDNILDNICGELGQVRVIFTSRGYIKRKILLLNMQSGDKLISNAINTIAKYYPAAVSGEFHNNNVRQQLEFYFAGATQKRASHKSLVSALHSSLFGLKRTEKITDVWLIIPLFDATSGVIDKLSDLSRIALDNMRVHVIIGSSSDEIYNSSWKKSFIRTSSAMLINEYDNYGNGLAPYLRAIENSTDGLIRFSAKALALINNNYAEWNSAKDFVNFIVRSAIINSNVTPITIGVRDVRTASLL